MVMRAAQTLNYIVFVACLKFNHKLNKTFLSPVHPHIQMAIWTNLKIWIMAATIMIAMKVRMQPSFFKLLRIMQFSNHRKARWNVDMAGMGCSSHH